MSDMTVIYLIGLEKKFGAVGSAPNRPSPKKLKGTPLLSSLNRKGH